MATNILYANQLEMKAWACERIGIETFRDDAHAIGLLRDGVLVGVVVYDTFSNVDCSMHVASDGTGRWLNRAFVKAAFMHPFCQWDFLRVTSPIAESNKKALRFNQKLGFKREGYHPYGAPDGALITLGLMRNECRWIPEEFRHMRK